MDSDALCDANALDNGSCDFAAVRTYIVKDQGFDEKDEDYKVQVLCHMLRLGFSLGDTFAAGFDTIDCSDAKRETSRGEVCVDVGDAFDDNACIVAGELASPSASGKSAGGSTTIIIAIIAVVVVLGIAAAAFMLTRNKGSAGAKGGVTSFENPMYDTSAIQTSGGAGGASAAGSGQTSGYMDVGGAPAGGGPNGYMDVQPTPEGDGAVYDNMSAPAGESSNSGYMDVGGAGQYIDDDDEEDV